MKKWTTLNIRLFAVLAVAVLFTTVFHSNAYSKSPLQIKGSDTMVHLVGKWAEDYMKINPSAPVAVTGGGSGTGIAALLNGTADIASASRKIEPEEVQIGKQKGLNFKEVPVGRDGIAVIVNRKNPVKNLSMLQLKQIFTGKATNWRAFGGANAPIAVYSRDTSSGTHVFFQEHVLKKEDYVQTARLMPSNAAIIDAVKSDTNGIGYVGLGYADHAKNLVKQVPVKVNTKSAAVLPSLATVKSGKYPIARLLYLYKRDNAPAQVNHFITFCLSPKGQKIVTAQGYIPLH